MPRAEAGKPSRAPRQRLTSKRRALSLNPALHGRALPLRPRIGNQAKRNLIAVQDQPMEHDGEIDVGDRPLAEQIFAAMAEQFRGAGTELA